MANDITKIDKALAADAAVAENGIVWHSASSEIFSLMGLYKEALRLDPPRYIRMPEEIAKEVNTGVARLYADTAGGRLRFATDSERVAIKVKWSQQTTFSHMPLTGSGGFDLYVDDVPGSRYVKTFVPPHPTGNADKIFDGDSKRGYEGEYKFETKEMRELQINFPLYNTVDELYIGLDEGANVLPHTPYKYEKPVVYYGSSITQGGCASKPSSSYQAIISRLLDVDHINLGFSGSAKGEEIMAEYIANLDMSVFVLDYDHNAPTKEHLAATHYPFYKTIREKNPTLPIICINAHNARPSRLHDERRLIIKDTYDSAKAEGDENVYFIDGDLFFPDDIIANCTVDGCHPNDLGFYFMAKSIAPLIKELLEK